MHSSLLTFHTCINPSWYLCPPCARLLGEVVHFPSEQNQLQQVESRLKLLQEQKAELPALFPWSGLVEKQRSLTLAHGLLRTAKAVDSEITTLKDQMKKQAHQIESPNLPELSWDGLESSVFTLIGHLTVSTF